MQFQGKMTARARLGYDLFLLREASEERKAPGDSELSAEGLQRGLPRQEVFGCAGAEVATVNRAF